MALSRRRRQEGKEVRSCGGSREVVMESWPSLGLRIWARDARGLRIGAPIPIPSRPGRWCRWMKGSRRQACLVAHPRLAQWGHSDADEGSGGTSWVVACRSIGRSWESSFSLARGEGVLGGRDYQSVGLLHASFQPARVMGRVRFTELATALGLERQPFTE